MKKKLLPGLFALILSLLTVNTFAQLGEIGNMMAAGTDDAKTLLQPYVTPVVNAFGSSLSGGWYNTPSTHKFGGFDLTFTINNAFIPKKDKSYLIDNEELNYLKLENPADNESQSIAGEKVNGPQIVYNVQDENENVVYTQPAFVMPKGMNVRMVPTPMIQLGIGLVKNTDVMVRFFPNFKYDGNEIGMWGIGGKHDIKQWIPGLKKAPVFKLSIMYGYTKLHTFVEMDVDKNSIGAGSISGEESNTWDDQMMKIYVRSQTANLLFGADFKVITLYGGLGFVTTKTTLKFEGDYPTVVVPAGEIEPVVIAVTDPLKMEIKNKDGGVTKPRLNAGFRVKMAIVTIHFDYSWANYSVLTAGLGISFR